MIMGTQGMTRLQKQITPSYPVILHDMPPEPLGKHYTNCPGYLPSQLISTDGMEITAPLHFI